MQVDEQSLIKQRIEDEYEKVGNATFINGTGNYGDNYKIKVVEFF